MKDLDQIFEADLEADAQAMWEPPAAPMDMPQQVLERRPDRARPGLLSGFAIRFLPFLSSHA